MSNLRVFILTLITMVAFAGNSLLCRFALKNTEIDPASFTSIRILSGAIALLLLLKLRKGLSKISGSWCSAAALFAYAAAFSFAYVTLEAGIGALLLFSAVQVTMIGYGLYSGERLSIKQTLGFILALGGLIWLMLPGVSAPPLFGSFLMICAGISWGIYSLRGRGVGDPASMTAGNFLRAAIPAILLSIIFARSMKIDNIGFLYAILSGAIASGAGYFIWYMALKGLKATTASIVQLSVPVIASIGGIIFLSESITMRLVVSSTAILGGIFVVVSEK